MNYCELFLWDSLGISFPINLINKNIINLEEKVYHKDFPTREKV